MSSLHDLQRRFRAVLLEEDDAEPPPEILGGAVVAATRLGVYRNNVIGALTGALRLTYPAIERLVGAEFFAAAAARFIVAAPPASADLYEYGAAFADFLAAFQPARGLVYLPDVARLEWAANRALHAPATPGLLPETILALAPASQADLRFVVHPSLSLLTLSYPAAMIWEAALAEDARERADRLASVELDAGGEFLAVLSGAGGLELVRLSSEAMTFALALTDGRALGEALELVAPDLVAPLLGGFLAQGFFSDCRLLAADVHDHGD